MPEANPYVIVRPSGPLFERADLQERFDREIAGEITELGMIGQRLVVGQTPRGASGFLRGSVFQELRGQPARRVEVVSSSVFYAPIVERGRRPGKQPPTAALMLWVTRKLGIADQRQARGVAFVIARKIGRVGTGGAAMFFKAAERLQPIVQTRLNALGARLTRVVGGA